jgi:hypothetical protein
MKKIALELAALAAVMASALNAQASRSVRPKSGGYLRTLNHLLSLKVRRSCCLELAPTTSPHDARSGGSVWLRWTQRLVR